MTFDEMVAEVQARGFNHVPTARIGRWVNQAVWELHGMLKWPFLEGSGTGTAPLSVPDLGTIEQVTDETNETVLSHAPWQSLVEQFGDLTTAGAPEWFYVAWPAGTPVVATYPTGAGVTIGVQYWKVTAELSGANTPAAPARFHGVYVDLAVRRGYVDSDNWPGVQALRGEIDRQVGMMVEDVLSAQVAGPDAFTQVTGFSVDG